MGSKGPLLSFLHVDIGLLIDWVDALAFHKASLIAMEILLLFSRRDSYCNVERKYVFGVFDQVLYNRAVQPQKTARCQNFRI